MTCSKGRSGKRGTNPHDGGWLQRRGYGNFPGMFSETHENDSELRFIFAHN
jgi:hypothetical protein